MLCVDVQKNVDVHNKNPNVDGVNGGRILEVEFKSLYFVDRYVEFC